MSIDNSKAHEIKRLTTPLSFNNSKAYDCDGNRINCVETLSDVRFIIEPNEGLLSDDEVLQYAPESKSACEIRLKSGFGQISDVAFIHESLPWMLGVYYVALLCIAVPLYYGGNRIGLLAILILIIVPLVYLYRIANVDNYKTSESKKQEQVITVAKKPVQDELQPAGGLESLKTFTKECSSLKVLFDVKEEVVRDLIKKRFAPPQITYDRFISIIDSAHEMFYNQYESVHNIVNFAAEDSPRIKGELDVKIGNMKAIINQIEDLTNELVININSEDGSSEEVKNLVDEMESLINSVKDY